jgi:hypothetical protein
VCSPCMCPGSLWSSCWKKMQPGEAPSFLRCGGLRHPELQTQPLLLACDLSLLICITDSWASTSQGASQGSVFEAPSVCPTLNTPSFSCPFSFFSHWFFRNIKIADHSLITAAQRFLRLGPWSKGSRRLE